jgi:hypothetical protein
MLPGGEKLPPLPISVNITIYHYPVITLQFPPLPPKGTVSDERNAGSKDIIKPFCIKWVYMSPDSPYLLWRLALLHMPPEGTRSVYLCWKLIAVKRHTETWYFLLSTYLHSIFRVSLPFVLLFFRFFLLSYFLPLCLSLFLYWCVSLFIFLLFRYFSPFFILFLYLSPFTPLFSFSSLSLVFICWFLCFCIFFLIFLSFLSLLFGLVSLFPYIFLAFHFPSFFISLSVFRFLLCTQQPAVSCSLYSIYSSNPLFS